MYTCSLLSREETSIRMVCHLKGKSHSTVFSFGAHPSGKSLEERGGRKQIIICLLIPKYNSIQLKWIFPHSLT